MSLSSESKSAPKAERKPTAYRQWLLSLINAPTPGLPDPLVAALAQPRTYRLAESWMRVSNIDRDGPRNEADLPRRELPPWQVLPPNG